MQSKKQKCKKLFRTAAARWWWLGLAMQKVESCRCVQKSSVPRGFVVFVRSFLPGSPKWWEKTSLAGSPTNSQGHRKAK